MTHFCSQLVVRRKAVWGPRRILAAATGLACLISASTALAGPPAATATGFAGFPGVPQYKLDRELTARVASGALFGTTRVIVEWQPGATAPAVFARYTTHNGALAILNGSVLDLPSGLLQALAADPSTLRIHYDRPAFKHDYRTTITIGARAIQQALGYTGANVGVAVVDSGVTSWHDDLTSRTSVSYPYGNQRVSAFVDFVNGQTAPYDDDGHGTHVAGIIAGNGYDSNGQNAGVAPDASLAVLKVIDANGNGTISNVIEALDWVLANHTQYNIRVVNLSIGAAIHESYWTDPLTLAAKTLVDAGVVVVAAAGNLGNNQQGQPQYGGIGAPGNAPWVLTVGASSTLGTTTRQDDTMASFSSRGPTYLDWAAKPDLVAPGVGTVSLAAPGSTLYDSLPAALSAGSAPTLALPYLSLSGTSMSAPVVSGMVALMLQANPNLTPNAVKAILQYTAQSYPGYDELTQGAGFANAVGAVRLALFYATAQPGQIVPTQSMWSRHIIWGNQELAGGVPVPSANAFGLGTTWGASATDAGDNIVWGTLAAGDNIVWGTAAAGDNIVWGTARNGDNIVWGTGAGSDNIVWGTNCGGADCANIVWGTGAGGDNIVWGTAQGGDNIVWGTIADADNIVWGTGASAGDNIVWGTSADGDNIVWGTRSGGDNIVWGTADNGTAILWDSTTNSPINWDTLAGLFPRLSDVQIFQVLVVLTTAPVATTPSPVGPIAPPPLVPADPGQGLVAPVLAPVLTPTIPSAPAAPNPSTPAALVAPGAAPALLQPGVL